MTTIEAKSCLALLAELFPQADLQTAELTLFRDALCKFDQADATDAIRNHRLTATFNRPQFNKILADLYERRRKSGPAGPVKAQESFADIIRQANPTLAHASDVIAYLCYHRHWWRRSSRTDAARASVVNSCVKDLSKTGMDKAEAERSTEFVFEDNASLFRSLLDDLGGRGNEVMSAEDAADAIA